MQTRKRGKWAHRQRHAQKLVRDRQTHTQLIILTSYSLIQQRWQGRTMLRQRWRLQRAGAGQGCRRSQTGLNGCWKAGAGWSEWNALPRWKADWAAHRNRTHPSPSALRWVQNLSESALISLRTEEKKNQTYAGSTYIQLKGPL